MSFVRAMLYACAAVTFVALGSQDATAKPTPFDPTGRAVAAPARAAKPVRVVMQQRTKKRPIASARKPQLKHPAVAAAVSPCGLSPAERARRIRRSVPEALNEEAANAQLVAEAAHKAGVPVELALGVGFHESRLDTCAISHTGVRGVMQVTRETARWLKLNRDKNPENVVAGVRILKYAIAVCGDDDFSCLARRYNASTPEEQARWAKGVQLASLQIEAHLERLPHLNISKLHSLSSHLAMVREGLVMARGGELL